LQTHPDNTGAPAPVSPWVIAWAPLIPGRGEVLDVACGTGRHSRYLASLGHRVLGVDRDAEALQTLRGLAGIETRLADLEGAPWPFAGRTFAGVIVTNYLHRPLLECLVDAVAAGGVLIYETFAAGNEHFGKPSNPAFLLRPGELLEAVRGRLRVVAYEDRRIDAPRPAMLQRICAVRESTSGQS
jgi:SAM-dependent methyltransferase